jgi:hypothetical protein
VTDEADVKAVVGTEEPGAAGRAAGTVAQGSGAGRPEGSDAGRPQGSGAGRASNAVGPSNAVRASNTERDVVAGKLQDAFAEGRLDDEEFDQRMRAALTAKTHAELDVLLTDLPAPTGAQTAQTAGRPGTVPPGRLAVAYKGTVRRAGRWRVPERYTTIVYKGSGLLDLRAAELQSPVTMIRAVAYKSRITVLVPPGVRVEMTGFGINQGPDEHDAGLAPAPDAPVLHLRGLAYKGTIETMSRPAEHPALP